MRGSVGEVFGHHRKIRLKTEGTPEAFCGRIEESDIQVDLADRKGAKPKESVFHQETAQGTPSPRGLEVEIDDLSKAGFLEERGTKDLSGEIADGGAFVAQDQKEVIGGGDLLEDLASEVHAGEGVALEVFVESGVFVHQGFPQAQEGVGIGFGGAIDDQAGGEGVWEQRQGDRRGRKKRLEGLDLHVEGWQGRKDAREEASKESEERGLGGRLKRGEERGFGGKEPDLAQEPRAARRDPGQAVGEARRAERTEAFLKGVKGLKIRGGGAVLGEQRQVEEDVEVTLEEVGDQGEEVGKVVDLGRIEPCESGRRERAEGRSQALKSAEVGGSKQEEGVRRGTPGEADGAGPCVEVGVPTNGIEDQGLFKEPAEGDPALGFVPQGAEGQACAAHVEAGGEPRVLVAQEVR